MGLFKGQFANVVEWEEYRDDIIFWKWTNREIKKGSKLIIRAGQDAIFMYNGKIEGIFKDEGSFDIESQIIPFLSTLKGFKFGFNSGVRAEVLFVNTKEFTEKWGTKNPILYVERTDRTPDYGRSTDTLRREYQPYSGDVQRQGKHARGLYPRRAARACRTDLFP